MRSSQGVRFTRTFEIVADALRTGNSTMGMFFLPHVYDFFLGNLALAKKPPPAKVTGIIGAMGAAQEAMDWIRLADILDYEIRSNDVVAFLPLKGYRLSVDGAERLHSGSTIIVRITDEKEPDIELVHSVFVRYLGPRTDAKYLTPKFPVEVVTKSSDSVHRLDGFDVPGIYRITARCYARGGEKTSVALDFIDVEVG